MDTRPNPVGDDDTESIAGAGGAGGGRGADDARTGAADALGAGAGRKEPAVDRRGFGCYVPSSGVRFIAWFKDDVLM